MYDVPFLSETFDDFKLFAQSNSSRIPRSCRRRGPSLSIPSSLSLSRVLRFQMLIQPIFTKIHSYSICNVEQQCTLIVEAFNHLSHLNVSLLNQLFRTGITIEFSSFSPHFESVLEDVIQFGYYMCTSWGLTKHRTLFSNTQMGYVELHTVDSASGYKLLSNLPGVR
jgi:hypothetical protein